MYIYEMSLKEVSLYVHVEITLMLVIRTNHIYIYMYIAVGGFNVSRQIYNSCK